MRGADAPGAPRPGQAEGINDYHELQRRWVKQFLDYGDTSTDSVLSIASSAPPESKMLPRCSTSMVSTVPGAYAAAALFARAVFVRLDDRSGSSANSISEPAAVRSALYVAGVTNL